MTEERYTVCTTYLHFRPQFSMSFPLRTPPPERNEIESCRLYFRDKYNYIIYLPKGRWADPGGTAIPGQPVAKAEQAPNTSPMSKNQFNIEVTL